MNLDERLAAINRKHFGNGTMAATRPTRHLSIGVTPRLDFALKLRAKLDHKPVARLVREILWAGLK